MLFSAGAFFDYQQFTDQSAWPLNLPSTTWGAIIFALGIIFGFSKPLYKYWQIEHTRPSFSFYPLRRGFDILVTVHNKTRLPVVVTARGRTGGSGNVPYISTEPFVLVWEESIDQNLQILPRNHGTLHIGTTFHENTQGDHWHGIQFYSYRNGIRNEFNWGGHRITDPPMQAAFMISLSTIPDTDKTVTCQLIMRDFHPSIGAELEILEPPIRGFRVLMRDMSHYYFVPGWPPTIKKR